MLLVLELVLLLLVLVLDDVELEVVVDVDVLLLVLSYFCGARASVGTGSPGSLEMSWYSCSETVLFRVGERKSSTSAAVINTDVSC